MQLHTIRHQHLLCAPCLQHQMLTLVSVMRGAHPCVCHAVQLEMAAEARGYTATKHQREVGTGYFDVVSTVCSNGASSTLALVGSTEASQF